jgi:hypothetical protein
MAQKWESPQIAYWDGFGDGRDLGRNETPDKMVMWIVITAIVMFVGGLYVGVWLW